MADCAVGDWMEWEECPNKCGWNTVTRERVINGEYKLWDDFVFGSYARITDTQSCDYIRPCSNSDDSDLDYLYS